MDRPRIRHIFPVFLTLALGLHGCTDNTGPGPTTGAVNFGTLAAGTEAAVATFVTGNGGTLGSLEFFAPFIGAVYGSAAPPPTLAAPSPTQTCLIPNVVQEVFAFDGVGYTATGQAAPANGQRFLLYAVTGGIPDTTDTIGHVDIVCASDLPTVDLTATVVGNGVTILQIRVTGLYQTFPNLDLTGFMKSSNGTSELTLIDGEISGGLSLQIGIDFLVLPDLVAGYRIKETLATGDLEAFVDAYEGLSSEKWRLDMDLSADTTGNILEGTALLDEKLIGCISGTLESVQASDPEQVGCSISGVENGEVSPEDLKALIESYDNLRTMYVSLRFLIDAGLSAIAQS